MTERSGAAEMMAPTFRSRFGQPSRRLPMPGANESSTVAWQSAHWMPIEVRFLLASKMPVTPTTASSSSRARVVFGSSRSTLPAGMSATGAAGSASASTLSSPARPRGADAGTDAAVCLAGDGAVQLQGVAPNAAPEVSKRKIGGRAPGAWPPRPAADRSPRRRSHLRRATPRFRRCPRCPWRRRRCRWWSWRWCPEGSAWWCRHRRRRRRNGPADPHQRPRP